MSAADSGLPHAAGCVVYRHDERGEPLLLLIKDQYGFWTLPKGHLDPGESAEGAAAREVLEETGVSGPLGPQAGAISYHVTTKKGRTYLKRVCFYLMRAAGEAIAPQAEEGISAAGWFPAAEALALIGYAQLQPVVLRALELIADEGAPRSQG